MSIDRQQMLRTSKLENDGCFRLRLLPCGPHVSDAHVLKQNILRHVPAVTVGLDFDRPWHIALARHTNDGIPKRHLPWGVSERKDQLLNHEGQTNGTGAGRLYSTWLTPAETEPPMAKLRDTMVTRSKRMLTAGDGLEGSKMLP